MIEHDPMAPLDDPSPWESLVQQARSLADYADQLSRLAPAELAPAEGIDPLKELATRANDVVSLTAACRRATWQALKDEGLTYAEIGRMWDGLWHSTISNALTQRKRSRDATDAERGAKSMFIDISPAKVALDLRKSGFKTGVTSHGSGVKVSKVGSSMVSVRPMSADARLVGEMAEALRGLGYAVTMISDGSGLRVQKQAEPGKSLHGVLHRDGQIEQFESLTAAWARAREVGGEAVTRPRRSGNGWISERGRKVKDILAEWKAAQ